VNGSIFRPPAYEVEAEDVRVEVLVFVEDLADPNVGLMGLAAEERTVSDA